MQVMRHNKCLDWTEQCLTSPPTQYMLSGRQFYRSKVFRNHDCSRT